MNVRYGMRHTCRACGVEATFHRLANRRAYACSQCGDNLYPTAGTVLQDTRTPLQLWFYAIYLFVVTRHGVSGKELQRQLGVTYKCAYRMGQQIRLLMSRADNFEVLKGHVEIDETLLGGRKSGVTGSTGKTIVLGMVERGGSMKTEVIPDQKMKTIWPIVVNNVAPGSIVSTDELRSYNLLAEEGYTHGAVNHSKKEYARTDEARGIMFSVNAVESFWRLFKRSVASTHIHISPQHSQKYLDEFTFRSNHRNMENAMFDLLVAAF
jgi:transposase-like protein